jgi:hypothetical protein
LFGPHRPPWPRRRRRPGGQRTCPCRRGTGGRTGRAWS